MIKREELNEPSCSFYSIISLKNYFFESNGWVIRVTEDGLDDDDDDDDFVAITLAFFSLL